MDCVIVKTFDADGHVTGERRLVGFFTSTAYHAPAQDVPLLRGRVEACCVRAGLDPDSHDGKALLAILEAYPRDELFQIDDRHALRARHGHPAAAGARTRGALHAPRSGRPLRELPGVRAARTLRRGAHDRFRAILQQALARHGDRRSPARAAPSRALAQALYTLKLDGPTARRPISRALEQALVDAATSWTDRLRAALATLAKRGRAAARQWRDWFPTIYRDIFDAARPWPTSSRCRRRSTAATSACGSARADQPLHRFTVRLFHPRKPIALSDILPLAENLGLRVLSEVPFQLHAAGGEASRCRC